MEEQKEQKRDPALEVENRDTQVEVQTENQTIIEVDLFQGKTPTHTRHQSLEEIAVDQIKVWRNKTTTMQGSDFINGVVTSPLSTLAPGLAGKKTETFLCQICYCNQNFDDKAVELKCGHKFCRDCLENWLRTQTDSGSIEHICIFRQEHPSQVEIEFQPKQKLGMRINAFGSVMAVEEGSVAKGYGIKVGWTLNKVLGIDEDELYIMLAESENTAEQLEKKAILPWTGVFDTYTEDFDAACHCVIENDVLEDLLGEETFKKYERFKRFAENEHLRECPWPDCQEEQLGDLKSPLMKCTKCEREYCYNHSNAHPGLTCEEYEAKMFQEFKRNRRGAGGKVIECPGCGRDIQKSSGCNHMTCPNCNTEFCWVCGKTITGSVYDHYENSSCYQFRYEAFPYIEVDDDDPFGVWGWFVLYCLGGLICSGPIIIIWALGTLIFVPVFTLRLTCSIWEDGISSLDMEDLFEESVSQIGEFFEALIPIACSCIFGWLCFGPLFAIGCIGGCGYLIWKYCIRISEKMFYTYFDGSEIDVVDGEYRVRTIEGEELLGRWYSLNSVIAFLESRRTTEGVLVVNVIKESGEGPDMPDGFDGFTKFQITLENGEVLPTVFESIEKVKKFLIERKQKMQDEDLDDTAVGEDFEVETPRPDPSRIYLCRFSSYMTDPDSDSDISYSDSDVEAMNQNGPTTIIARDDRPSSPLTLGVTLEDWKEDATSEGGEDFGLVDIIDINPEMWVDENRKDQSEEIIVEDSKRTMDFKVVD